MTYLLSLSRVVWLLMFSVVSMLPLSVSAEEVEGLYDARQSVASQSQRDLLKATSEGLKTVLVRVSGHSSVLDNPGVKAAIRKPKPFLNQYSYERVQDPLSDQELIHQVLFKVQSD